MRLAKYLANAGIASRRAAEPIIAAGRVTVDGVTVRDPARDVDASQAISVDGRPLSPIEPEQRVVYAVHKPAGVLSTAKDTHGRPTVVGLVPSTRRLYPVGRLDADSTGLILLTDDGDLAHRLTHPSFEVDKTYLAVVGGGPVREAALDQLRRGIELEDGLTAPAQVRRLRPDTLALTIHEGRKRQVKRMCAAVGHPVLSLTRVQFGPLSLGDLPAGGHRRLGPKEIGALAAAGRHHPPAAADRPAPTAAQ
jgi:23S rRNA pseudouridine2605 synthase